MIGGLGEGWARAGELGGWGLGLGAGVWGAEGAEGLGRGGIYHSIHGTILYNMVPYHTI